jgi:hypothetical protein
MKYTDRIYGEFEISEPVILGLINSPALQRLKGVAQAGYQSFWLKPDVGVVRHDQTRFEHSVGVYLLLKRYGASLKEQIAGLIHDVSHSAFSHCIDCVLEGGSEKEQDYQDKIFEDFVRKTAIPEILLKYGFDPEYILDDKNFPLKEKLLPDLCADRIDYSLRGAVFFNELEPEDKNYLLDNLTAENGDWVFKNLESARAYAELFLKLDTVYWSSFPSAAMGRMIGDCLKHALEKNYISESDLYTTDREVLDKVKKFLDKDQRLKLLWERVTNKTKAENNPGDYDVVVFHKSRVVDPLFKENGILKRLSEVDPRWSEIIKEGLKPKQYFLKFA